MKSNFIFGRPSVALIVFRRRGGGSKTGPAETGVPPKMVALKLAKTSPLLENQTKLQNMYGFLIGRHRNLDEFLELTQRGDNTLP